MNHQDRIVRDAQIVGGEPVLKGTRVTRLMPMLFRYVMIPAGPAQLEADSGPLSISIV